MLILYKNDRNVRFVLFTKTSSELEKFKCDSDLLIIQTSFLLN